MLIVFAKAHIKGYIKKNGKYVAPHEDKRPTAAPAPLPAAKPAPKQPTVKPVSAWSSWADMLDEADRHEPPPSKWGGFTGSATTWSGGGLEGQGSLFGSGSFHAAKSYPDAIKHPENNDEGKPVTINVPSKPTAPETWTDPKALAVFVPGGETPAELNGVAFAPWDDHPATDEGWDYVDGQMDDLDEPPFVAGGKEAAAGVIITEPDGRVWVVRPTNGYAGYDATFPKGHTEYGMSLQSTAIKECFEESGLKVRITGFVGDVDRTLTRARYYSAVRVGGTPKNMGWESQACVLVPPDQLHAYLNRSADREMATAAGIAAPAGLYETTDDWTKVGKQGGSNPGGVFEDHQGVKWYVKLPKSADAAKNEVLAGKLYEAAGIPVPELKLVTVGSKVAVASKIIEGMKSDAEGLRKGTIKGVAEGFAVDAWLANWDVVGMVHDNLLRHPDGHAVRVDTGGALLYRAQGDLKGQAFGPVVGELQTLRDGKNMAATDAFGKLKPAQIAASIKRVHAIPDDKIRALVSEYGPGDEAARTKLADLLIARKNSMKA